MQKDTFHLTTQNTDASISLVLCQSVRKTIRKCCELYNEHEGIHLEKSFVDLVSTKEISDVF